MHAPLGFDPQLLELTDHPLSLRLALHDKPTIPAQCAVMREAEKVERLGPPQTLPSALCTSKLAEHDQPGLILVQRQAELGQSFREISRHLSRIDRALEFHHKIVCIAHDRNAAMHTPTPALDPEIEDVMQEDV